MQLIYILLFTLTSVLMLYNIDCLLSLVNNIRNKFRLNIFLILFIILSAVYTLSRTNTNSPPLLDVFLLSLYYVLLFVNLYLFNKCSLKRILYVCLIYLSVDSILQSVLHYLTISLFDNYNDMLIILVNSTLICIFAFLIIKLLVKKHDNFSFQVNAVSKRIYILILLSLIFSGGLIEFQLTIINTQVQNTTNRVFTIITIFLLLFIIGSLVFNCISRAYFENVSSILEKQVNEQVDYYKKIDKIDKELRNFRHDYKNHMICVQSLIEAKEYAEATEYLEGITLHKTILSRGFSSGNSIADVLLSDKSEWAEKAGVEIQFEGVIYENIPPADLCTILSNAIDNAIEACEKIQSDEQKVISVKCSYIKRIQFIDITNPVSEDVKISNNAVETSKSDKNIHGIGLYNIRRTVMKYDGEFEISCKDKIFAMSIAFKTD